MKILEYIRQNADICEADEQILMDCFVRETFSKGEQVFREGDFCPKIYFVEKGMLRGYYYAESGKEVTLWFSAENSFWTALDSFVSKTATHNYCEALEDSVVYSISSEKMEELLNRNHAFAKFAFQTLLEITRELADFLGTMKFMTAKEKYIKLMLKNPRIFQRVPQTIIASYLGITAETLSRLRAEK